ncbi:MAG: condensation domain-containing protein, partial [Actinomycetota bacterium]|nr:condensation domain-containing protein [Actinomycetota bacterium]
GTNGDGGPDVYAVQLVLALAGPVDPAALRAAGEALLGRHANLRAGFRFGRSGRPAQLLPRAVELPWREVDVSDLDPDERSARLADLVAAERAHRFDLARPPALRLVLVRLGGDDHRLVLTSHHILLDGWSTPLLVRELLALYAARGDASALPPVTPYRDYLGWLLEQDHDAAHAAWERALDGLQRPTLLAPSAGRVPGPSAEHVTELSAELTADLVTTARQHGMTLNTVLQGAWAVVLAATTGRDDVVFGTTVAARPAEIPAVENMVGLLINTVPVRVRLRPAEPLCQALRRLQDEQADLLGSQHVGLAEIQRRAGLGELFDTLVVFENHPRDLCDEVVAGLRVTGVESHDATHYPLTVVVTPGERLRLALHHRIDAITPAEAAALAGRLERVLTAIATAPTLSVGRCGIVSRDEARQVLDNGLGTAQRPLPAASLPSLFAAQVVRTPHAPAVRADGRELTYAELDRRANRLAHLLRHRGVGPERLVALALERSVEHLVAFLAVQKAGGACLPLDLDHPADRLAYVLADAAPALILTTPAASARLPAEVAIDRLLLDGADGIEGDTRAGDPGAPDLGDDDLRRAAYVVYTSGSSGRPKGVVVTHSSIASLVATAQDRFGVGPGSRVGQFAALSFDIAVWELCMALLSGGCLVVVPSDRRTDVDALLTFARDEQLTVLAIPPSLLAVVPLEAALPDRIALLVGSETVPAELVSRWSERVRFVVAYGVTESTVNQTLWTAPPGWRGRTVPIGRPDP